MLTRSINYLTISILLLSSPYAIANPLGDTLSKINQTPSNALVKIHSKRCKFYHPDGYVYKDHCPHRLKKGSRKKRAAIGAGIGAAVGAGIGAIAGGGRGAAIGAGVGAGAGAIGGAASLKRCWYFDEYGRRVKVKCRQR